MTLANWLALGGATVVLGLVVSRPRLGFIALAAFYPLNDYVPRSPLPGLNWETVITSLAVGVTLLRFGFRTPPLRFSAPVTCYILILFIGFLVIASWAPARIPGFSFFENLKVAKSAAFTAVLFFPMYFWLALRLDRRRVLEGMSLGLALVAIASVLDTVFNITPDAAAGRPTGLLFNPSALGLYLAAFSLIQLHLFLDREITAPRRHLHLALYVVSLTGVVFSLGRGGWLALILGHAVWFMYRSRRMLLLLGVALLLTLTVAFPLLPYSVRERIEETFRTRNTVFQAAGASFFETSAATRIVFYRIGGDMFLDSPVWGHGLGSFKLLTPKYGARYGMLKHKDPHSLVTKLGAEMGLLGLGVFVWLAVLVVQLGRRLWREDQDERTLGPLLLAIGMALLVGNLVSTSFIHIHLISAFFWLLFGMAARAAQDLGQQHV